MRKEGGGKGTMKAMCKEIQRGCLYSGANNGYNIANSESPESI